jgi:hypothetical protein
MVYSAAAASIGTTAAAGLEYLATALPVDIVGAKLVENPSQQLRTLVAAVAADTTEDYRPAAAVAVASQSPDHRETAT